MAMRFLILLLLALAQALQAQDAGLLSGGSSLDAAGLLRVEEAFAAQAVRDGDQLSIGWQIAPGYYLYRKQFRLVTDGNAPLDAIFESGETTYDPFFDEELEVYRDQTLLEFPHPGAGTLYLRFQGCADAGYCYPPSWLAFALDNTGHPRALGLVAGPAAEAPTASGRSGALIPALLVTGLFVGLALLGAFLRRGAAPRA